MGQSTIVELFYENPGKEFYLRQISRLTKVPKTTVSRILDKLINDKIIKKVKSEPFERYEADTTSLAYRFYKKQSILDKIFNSKLVEHIVDKAHPKVIVLFGSCARGEYVKNSDIDVFVEASSIDIGKIKLGHKVNLFFDEDIHNLSKELKQNIINGVILYGVLRL